MKVIIIGGGIGGMATAIALAQTGHEVEIFERAEELHEIGAGLQISPNGIKVLRALDLERAIEPFIFEPLALEMGDARSMKRIFRLPLEKAKERWGAPYYNIHRAHLHQVLIASAEAHPNIAIHLGREFTVLEDSGTTVSAHFSDGSASRGDILVGADGLSSRVVNHIASDLQLSYSGTTSWRAIIPNEGLKNPPPPTSAVWKSSGMHCVTTLIDGGKTINFVGLSVDDWPHQARSVEASATEFNARFGKLNPILSELTSKIESYNKWALWKRGIPPSLYKGRVILVGDAAHPMQPSFAQGAVMALEDAYGLSACLKGAYQEGFARFEKLRRQRVSQVVRRSFANQSWFHRGGLKRLSEDFIFHTASKIYPEVIYKKLDGIYSYDIVKECG